MRHALLLHPGSHCDAVSGIEVDVVRPQPGRLTLRYIVTGRICDLLLPAQGATERADELWRHTCFEAFVLSAPPAYFEYNFSPSRQWAGYVFDEYRSGMRDAYVSVAPCIGMRVSEHELDVDVALDRLPFSGAWRIGLCAVVEEKSGHLSYWALAHPSGKPDFHHSDGFVLILAGTA
jgi:hypothetical protein